MSVTRRDYLYRRGHQALEAVGLGRGWFRELSAYYRQMSRHEFWVRYTLGRMDAETLWQRKPRTTEADYRAFYSESDYWVLRQMYHSRHESYFAVADAMRTVGKRGNVCEYGCGVAPVTAWLLPHFRLWAFTLVDLDTPMLAFARWRFRSDIRVGATVAGTGADLPLTRLYDTITCFDVLEHVINPLQVVQHLAAHLTPSGTLHLNFINAAGGENLAESAAERPAVIAWLNAHLVGVRPLRVDGDNLAQVYARYDRPP